MKIGNNQPCFHVDLQGDLKVLFSRGSPVGARVVEWRGEGLYGRPCRPHRASSMKQSGADAGTAGHTVPQTASIKAHSTHLLPTRPYGDEAPATFTSPWLI